MWEKFATAPEPVGYDPYIIPMWKDGPASDQFAVLRLAPYRLRVMPGTVMTEGEGAVLTWSNHSGRRDCAASAASLWRRGIPCRTGNF